MKTATLIELPPLTKLCKEDDSADSLYFVIQGELVASYTFTQTAKQAQFLGKKFMNSNADGLFKGLDTINLVK